MPRQNYNKMVLPPVQLANILNCCLSCNYLKKGAVNELHQETNQVSVSDSLAALHMDCDVVQFNLPPKLHFTCYSTSVIVDGYGSMSEPSERPDNDELAYALRAVAQ
jgi:hypothetical protein